MLRRRWVVVMVVLASGLGGCNRGAAPLDAQLRNYEQPAAVTLRIDGHRGGVFEGAAKLHVLRSRGPGDVRLFVLGLASPVDVGGATADAYVQLKNYAGSGDYRALPGGGAGAQDMPNDAYVTWIRSDDKGKPVEAYRYDQVAAPCTFEISDDGDRGKATCEGLSAAGAADAKVAMTMSWSATGKRKDLPTS